MARTTNWKPTPKRLEEITEWVSKGYTEGSIAKAIGYKNHSQFSELKRKYPEIQAAIDEGKRDVEQLLVSELFRIAMDRTHSKQVTVIMFMLKTQFKWRDSDPSNIIVKEAERTTGLEAESDESTD